MEILQSKQLTKKLIAVIMITLILHLTVTNDYMNGCVVAEGSAIAAVGAGAIVALVGTAISYAGYNATKKQTKYVAGEVTGIMDSWTDCVKNYMWDKAHDVNDFCTYISENYGGKHKSLAVGLGRYVWGTAAEKIEDTVDEVRASWEVLTGGQDDNDNDNKPQTSKWIRWGARAGVLATVSAEVIKILSFLSQGVIKEDLNAEYEKAKGKYNWEKLGFKTDYDTVNISSQDGSKFNGINANAGAATGRFDYRNTLFEIDGGAYRHIVYLGAGTEKTALFTVHNPNTDKWLTYIYPEDILYSKLADIKSGNSTFNDFLEFINNHDYAKFDSSTRNFYDFFEMLKVDNHWDQGLVFQTSLFKRQQSYGSPLHVCLQKTFPADGTVEDIFLNKSNTTVYNLGKTADIYYINFTSNTKFTGATTALNGLAELKPTVADSKYSNTQEEIDKVKEISLDTNVNYSSTDAQMKDTASDNDLDLQVIEDATGDIADSTKGIWESIKALPGQIWSYFSTSFSNLPHRIWNSFKAQLQKIESILKWINGNVKKIPDAISSIPDSVQNGLKNLAIAVDFPGVEDLKNVISNVPNAGIFTDIAEAVASQHTLLELIDTALNNLPTALPFPDAAKWAQVLPFGSVIESLESIPDSVTNLLSSAFAPDTDAISDAFKEVQKNFGFIGDFRGLANGLINMTLEPHDYIIVYNWDKAHNKYDQRDSYKISFSWYAPYKEYVDAIFIAFVYIFFVWRIFIKLASIIRGTGGDIVMVHEFPDAYKEWRDNKK
ncbi:hypothetical protein ACTNBM_04835 [Lachnospiraceae bacterium HCP1S3_C3]